MKTLEQTVRRISVGLTTAAWAVMVTAATLFCGVTSARAQEPDNRIDWRWGRPGVMVVTNAPTAVTVTNIATEVATVVAGGVANTMFGPRVTALEGALDGGTNNWDTAYGWGNHAGLYKAIGWVPSWGDITDIPQDFPPSFHQHDYTAVTNPPWLTEYTETDEIALSRVTIIEANTNNWNTAYGWGDHAGLYKAIGWFPSWAEVTGKPDLFDWSYDSLTDVPTTFPPEAHRHDYIAITNAPWLTEYTETDEIALAALYGTNTILEAAITNEAALRTAHTEDTGNPHDVTAAQIGAITAEQDLAALRAHHYGSPDIVESPAEWFVFNVAGIITAFNYQAGRENVVIPWEIGGVPVTAIGASAFAGCTSLTSVAIPNSVTSIGNWAFSYCESLTSVTIGNSVTSIGDSAFFYCESLTSVTIGNSVTSIGDSAFSYCTALTSVAIPNSVTSIGSGAFSDCTFLTSVNIGNSVTSIGSGAFFYCESLTSVTIGNSVTSIGDSAFPYCTALTSLYFDGNAPTIGPDIFYGIPANQVTVYVTNPQATGWGDELDDMSVVRLDLHGDKIYQAGELVATTGHVAQAIAAIPEPDLSGKADVQDGVATNLSTHGWLALPQTAATNLVLRIWASNDVIYASEVYQ